MNHTCLHHKQAAIDLSEKMIEIVDEIVKHCDDDGTLLIFSVIRDSAYKIRRTADRKFKGT